MIKRIRNVVLLGVILFTPTLAAESLRVDADWLRDHLGDARLVILDVRLQTDYEVDHIPGALSFPDALTYQQKSTGGRIVEPDVIQALLRERGVQRDDLVVVYDNGGLVDASRVLWSLEVYGVQQVRVLDKGLAGWVAKAYPLTGEVPAVTPSDFVPAVDHRRIASKFATQLATRNPRQVVVDARPAEAYRGETSTAKRFGHIPTAVNIPVHANINNERDGLSLRHPEELLSLYGGLPKDGKVILYCEIGRVSATSYLALRELGYDVANYDASWREWGNDLSLPIEK
jgi:thiosulfate/3-mercaptopyruvate sulfurtransferase